VALLYEGHLGEDPWTPSVPGQGQDDIAVTAAHEGEEIAVHLTAHPGAGDDAVSCPELQPRVVEVLGHGSAGGEGPCVGGGMACAVAGARIEGGVALEDEESGRRVHEPGGLGG